MKKLIGFKVKYVNYDSNCDLTGVTLTTDSGRDYKIEFDKVLVGMAKSNLQEQILEKSLNLMLQMMLMKNENQSSTNKAKTKK